MKTTEAVFASKLAAALCAAFLALGAHAEVKTVQETILPRDGKN